MEVWLAVVGQIGLGSEEKQEMIDGEIKRVKISKYASGTDLGLV
jgi:hypothetical protein